MPIIALASCNIYMVSREIAARAGPGRRIAYSRTYLAKFEDSDSFDYPSGVFCSSKCE
jgi:hypothetical protein